MPPSTWITTPVTYEAFSEARKTTTFANSSGVPMRPSGTSMALCATYSSTGMPACLAPPRNRSVMIRPGHTTLMVMLSLPSSGASVLLRPATPGRTALESRSPSTGCLTDTDWIVRMRPHLRARMIGATSRPSLTTDNSDTSNAPYHCSSVISCRPPRGGPPQFATSTSIPPNVCFVRATTDFTSSALVTSAVIARTSAPVLARTSSAAVLTSASVRAHMATRAPSAAKPIEHALPIPLLAAVTSATLPLSPRSMLCSPRASLSAQMIPEELGDPTVSVGVGLRIVSDSRPDLARPLVLDHVGEKRPRLPLDVEVVEGSGIEHDGDVSAAAAHRLGHPHARRRRGPIVGSADQHQQGPNGELRDQRFTAAGIHAHGGAITRLGHHDTALARPFVAGAIDESRGEHAAVGPADDADVFAVDVTACLQESQCAHAVVEAFGVRNVG